MNEQGGFRIGRGYVDEIFAMKMIVEKYLEKDTKQFAALINLEKTYDSLQEKFMGCSKVIWHVRKFA